MMELKISEKSLSSQPVIFRSRNFDGFTVSAAGFNQILAPVGHLSQDMAQTQASFTQAVFDTRRDFIIGSASNNAGLFQFTKLEGQYALGNTRKQSPQLARTQGTVA